MRTKLKILITFITIFVPIVLILAQPSFAATAYPKDFTLYIDGKQMNFYTYDIGYYKYLKLRDIAYALNGTAKQFEIVWYGEENLVYIIHGSPYTIVGGEMESKGDDPMIAEQTDSKIYIYSDEDQYLIYNFYGYNYISFYDFYDAFGCWIEWDFNKNAYTIDTQMGTEEHRKAVAKALNSNPGVKTALSPSDTTYYDFMEALLLFQESGWEDDSSPLLADSIFVTHLHFENHERALFTGAAYSYYYYDELSLYYAFVDINGDGTPELFIGPGDNSYSIFSVYTIQDGIIKAVIQRHGIDEILNLCIDGTIVSSTGYTAVSRGNGMFARYSLTPDGELITEYYFHRTHRSDFDISYQYEYTDMDGTVYTDAQIDEIAGPYGPRRPLNLLPLKDFFE